MEDSGVERCTGTECLLLLLSRFSRVRLCNPIDSSPPGSPVPGILQARTLEWVAVSFSNAFKWKVKVKTLSRVRLLATSWTAAHQAPPSMGFSRQEYWSGVPLPSPLGFKAGPYCIFVSGNSKITSFSEQGTLQWNLKLWEIMRIELKINKTKP